MCDIAGMFGGGKKSPMDQSVASEAAAQRANLQLAGNAVPVVPQTDLVKLGQLIKAQSLSNAADSQLAWQKLNPESAQGDVLGQQASLSMAKEALAGRLPGFVQKQLATAGLLGGLKGGTGLVGSPGQVEAQKILGKGTLDYVLGMLDRLKGSVADHPAPVVGLDPSTAGEIFVNEPREAANVRNQTVQNFLQTALGTAENLGSYARQGVAAGIQNKKEQDARKRETANKALSMASMAAI